jgi:hypothetical protein
MLLRKVFSQDEKKIISIPITQDAATGGQRALNADQLPFIVNEEYKLVGCTPEGLWIVERFKSVTSP